FDAHGRLAHAHGHALPFLAAGAHAAVQAHVVADHAHARECVGAVADQGGALHGVLDLAVLDPVGFAGREDELAARDVDLAAAEVGGVQAFLDAGHDLGRVLVAAQHVGVGHARHGRVRVALAPAVAGGLDAHQAGVHRVLAV